MVPIKNWGDSEKIVFSHIHKIRYMFELGEYIVYVFVATQTSLCLIDRDLRRAGITFETHWDERRDIDG